MDELDILRCANLLLKNYGLDDGLQRAALRADALLNQGDLVGEKVWLRIIAAMKELARTDRSELEALH
jgi:hypothetical protein